jgi:hypothetical protein|tara:strand:- start:887 stop:1555 length:669 start_codon:yes stop_codon:yes gene_type:complete
MGLVTGHHSSGMDGLGNSDGTQNIRFLSGSSYDNVDIYNYNKITMHINTNKGQPESYASRNVIVLENKGCMYNGYPMWTFEDGYYDGDFNEAVHHRHHHSTIKHMDERHGSAICQGQSHILRWGNTGSWEVLTHGGISAWTTATTRNFFAIQGTGNTTTGLLQPNTVGALGHWQMVTASTSYNGFAYKPFTPTSGGTAIGSNTTGSITATTAFGPVNPMNPG